MTVSGTLSSSSDAVPGAGVLIARSACTIISVALVWRSLGSFAMPRAITSSTAGDSSGRWLVTRGGGLEMWALSTATSEGWGKGTVPHRHS